MIKQQLYLLVLLCLLSLGACVGGRHWPDGKALYTGAKFKIKKQGNKASIGELKTQVREILLTPKPNKRFLGFRAGVGRYHIFRDGSWAQRKLGHTPVFFDAEQVKRTENALLNAAKHNGWLDARVASHVKWDKKHFRAKVKYRIELTGNPYRLTAFSMPKDDNQLGNFLRSYTDVTLRPKPGDVYKLNRWIAFRQQVVKQAHNQGFYFLSPEHLQFVVDSVRNDKSLGFELDIKSEVPVEALVPWQISEVHVYPNYQLQTADTSETVFDLDGIRVHRRGGEVLRNQILRLAVTLRPGDVYSEILHANTVAQLHNLRVFSSIQVKFEPIQEEVGKLRCRILLTPFLPQTVEVAASGVVANNLYSGAEVGVRYVNRNLSRRGELFQIKPAYSHLFLLGEESGSSLQTFDMQASFQRPYLQKSRKKDVLTPVYLLGSDVNYQNALYAFPRDEDGIRLKIGLNELKAEAGLTRKAARNSSWSTEVKPLAGSLQFARLYPSAFNDLLDDLILADTSFLAFATQLSYAPRIVLAYDSRFKSNSTATHFFRQMFRFRYGGYLVSDTVEAAIGNARIIQFTTETDARIYRKLRPRVTAAGRFVGNVALPLAGSNPQAFQISDLYSAGGSNGLRSFALRSLGPGGWSDEADTSALGIVRNNGNMLLQLNTELRYRRKNLETALFADVGNSWNTYQSASYPGGDFRLSRFYRELGFGSGLGLRYFYSLLVFRLDMGYALHDPSRPVGERWTSDFGLDRLRFAFAFGQAF